MSRKFRNARPGDEKGVALSYGDGDYSPVSNTKQVYETVEFDFDYIISQYVAATALDCDISPHDANLLKSVSSKTNDKPLAARLCSFLGGKSKETAFKIDTKDLQGSPRVICNTNQPPLQSPASSSASTSCKAFSGAGEKKKKTDFFHTLTREELYTQYEGVPERQLQRLRFGRSTPERAKAQKAESKGFLQKFGLKKRNPMCEELEVEGTALQANLSAPDSKSAKHKTKICKNTAGGKICPFGDNCWFAHGHMELRAQNDDKLTQLFTQQLVMLQRRDGASSSQV